MVAFSVSVMLVCPLTIPAARASSRTADTMGAWPAGAETRGQWGVSRRPLAVSTQVLAMKCLPQAPPGLQPRLPGTASPSSCHRRLSTYAHGAGRPLGSGLPAWRSVPRLRALSWHAHVARGPAGPVRLQRRRVCGRHRVRGPQETSLLALGNTPAPALCSPRTAHAVMPVSRPRCTLAEPSTRTHSRPACVSTGGGQPGMRSLAWWSRLTCRWKPRSGRR